MTQQDPNTAPQPPVQGKPVNIQVQRGTRDLVQQVAKAQGRSADVVILRAIRRLQKDTAEEKRASDQDWANS